MLLAFMNTIGGARVSLSNQTIADTTFSPANASAAYQLTSAGVVNSITTLAGTVALGDWIIPTSAAGASYEVMATEDSGSVTSGTIGAWSALSSTETWTVTRTIVGSSECTLTIQIRQAGTGTVLASATIMLEASKEA